jgi:integrase
VQPLGKNKSLASIGLQDVRRLIKAKQLAGQKAMARALLGAVRPFFKWCVAESLITVSPLATYSDAPGAVAQRERTLDDAEVKTLWQATEAPTLWNSFYRLLLLTAQRREEVAGIRRTELDLDACLWTIPGERTKNGKEHIVHLSPLALAEIARCPTEGPYLFPSTPAIAGAPTPKKPTISGYSKAKTALDKRMGNIPEWNIHDLRRTAATWMDGAGFETNIIEWVLNHISGTRGGLIGTYQRHPHLVERKLAIEAWNKHMAELTGQQEPETNVVSFQKAPVVA